MAIIPLIKVSIVVACLIVIATCTNIVGIQTVTSSNQKIIKNNIRQKELSFQTILDIANKRETQNIIQNSETNGALESSSRAPGAKPFLINLKMHFSGLSSSSQILIKKYLNHVFKIGLILSKTLSTSKIHLTHEHYQESNQGLQKEKTAVIKKNDELNKLIEQLSDLPCDCENDITNSWYPGNILLCLFLYPFVFIAFIWFMFNGDTYFLDIMNDLGIRFNCQRFWL